MSYGPQPKEVIEIVRHWAFVAVRGNHDHALAFNVDPRCSPANQDLVLAALHHHRTLLTKEDVYYLAKRPRSQKFKLDGDKFYAARASPLDTLYRYTLTPDLPGVAVGEDHHRAAHRDPGSGAVMRSARFWTLESTGRM